MWLFSAAETGIGPEGIDYSDEIGGADSVA